MLMGINRGCDLSALERLEHDANAFPVLCQLPAHDRHSLNQELITPCIQRMEVSTAFSPFRIPCDSFFHHITYSHRVQKCHVATDGMENNLSTNRVLKPLACAISRGFGVYLSRMDPQPPILLEAKCGSLARRQDPPVVFAAVWMSDKPKCGCPSLRNRRSSAGGFDK